MKIKIISFLTLLISITSYSQEQFIGLNGWTDQNGLHLYEYRGTQMAIISIDNKWDDQVTLDSIKQLYSLGKILKTTNIDSDKNDLNKNFKIIESEGLDKQGAIIYKTTYLIEKNGKSSDLILFASHNPRIEQLEKILINAYYANELAPYTRKHNTQLDRLVGSIRIADKEVELSNYYYWLSPNTVETNLSSKFSWSVFPALEDAKLDSENRIARDKTSKMEASLDEYINVNFLGDSTIARVVTYYPADKTMPFDRYYIVHPVGDYYVSCELTNLIKFDGDRSLPKELKKLISFDDGEGFTDWLSKKDWKEIEKRSGQKLYWPSKVIDDQGYERLPLIEVGVGSYLPLGNAYSVMGVSPGVSFYFSWPPVIDNFTLDFGSGLYYSTKGKKYFREKDTTYRLFSFVPLYARCKYQIRMAKYFYVTPYIGGGVHFAMADFGDEDSYYEDDDSYISTEFKCPLAAVGGINFRYKSFSIFAEYNFVNYNWKKDVGRSFNKGCLNLGLAYHIFN